MKRLLTFLCALTLVFGLAGQAGATLIAYQVPANTAGNQEWTGSMGMDFDVNQTIEVTALGVFDSFAVPDSLQNPLTVQLWDRSNTSTYLEQIVFPSGTPGYVIGGSRFIDLSTPRALASGFQGSIVAFGFDTADPNYNIGYSPGDILTTDDGGGALSFVGYRWNDLGDTSFPTSNVASNPGNPDAFGAGTFSYNVVPEPATLVLLGTGLVGFGIFLFGRKKYLKRSL